VASHGYVNASTQQKSHPGPPDLTQSERGQPHGGVRGHSGWPIDDIVVDDRRGTSAAMLMRAGYRARVIFALWATVLVAGMVAAPLGKVLIGTSDSLAAVFCEAVAGGAVLALVAHTMIPEAIDDGGSLAVIPTVAGFLLALYLALLAAMA
jgi:DNA-binding transcriptional LysR family regulator